MSTGEDLDQVIEQYRLALGELVKGNPEPVQKLFSHREDVTLANPLGPPARGWEQVARTIKHAASILRDGEISGFEIVAKYVTPELAYIVYIERAKARVSPGKDIVPLPLRVTMIFRPEEDTWKVAHRHADTITTARPAESLMQE